MGDASAALSDAPQVLTDNFRLYPTDIDGEPIQFDGNPAHMPGVLHEVNECIRRTGIFKLLLEDGCVLSGSKLAIDSPDAIPFLRGVVADDPSILAGAAKFSAANPCPPTPQRRAALGASAPTTVTEISKADSNSFVHSPHLIVAEKLNFANWLLMVNLDGDVKADFAADANGDGIELLEVMENFAKTAEARDITLVLNNFSRVVAAGHPGPVDLSSFNIWLKNLKKERIKVPPNKRMDDDDLAQQIVSVMEGDSETRDLFETQMTLAGHPTTIKRVLTLARTLLRRRKVGAQIDDRGQSALIANRGSVPDQSALIATLKSLNISESARREIEKKHALAVGGGGGITPRTAGPDPSKRASPAPTPAASGTVRPPRDVNGKIT